MQVKQEIFFKLTLRLQSLNLNLSFLMPLSRLDVLPVHMYSDQQSLYSLCTEVLSQGKRLALMPLSEVNVTQLFLVLAKLRFCLSCGTGM